jgi:histidinol dehydrogenase
VSVATTALSLRKLDTRAPGFDAALEKLIAFEAAQDPAIDATVAAIIADVRARGDAAVLDYTRRFDRLTVARVADLAIDRAAMRARDCGAAHPRISRAPE